MIDQDPLPASRWKAYAVVALVLTVVISALAGVTLQRERERLRERAMVATQNISALLDQHIHDVFEEVELSVRATAFYTEEMMAAGRLDSSRLDRFLFYQASLIPALDGLRVATADGVVRYGINRQLIEPVSIADTEFFSKARSQAERSVVVMGPVFAPIAGKWVIVFAQRLRRPDGSFGGVVYANLPTVSFDGVFSSVKLGRYGAATIRGTDMALVHRVPDTKNAVGSRKVSKELAAMMEQSPEGGDYIAKTALDGIERSNSFRRLKKYPFIVLVGLATDDYLGGWSDHAVVVGGLSGFGILVVWLIAGLAYRSQRKLQRELAQKIRLTADLERAAVERSALNAELEVKIRQAEAATRAKNAFLANVSHELNTPLHQIHGMAALIGRQPLNEKQSGWLSKLTEASQTMSELIRQVLEYSRLEIADPRHSRVPLRVAPMLESVAARWAPTAARQSSRLQIQAEPIADALVGDPQRIEQVLDLYLDNAVKFGEAGQITLAVSLVERCNQTLTLKWSVADQGPGLGEVEPDRVFNVFEVVDDTMTRERGGMGLGLATARKLVNSMGGSVGCESAPGGGALFWFTTTLARA